MIGADEDEVCLVDLGRRATAVDDRQRYAAGGRRSAKFRAVNARLANNQRESAAELLEDVAAVRKPVRRQMMARACDKAVFADGAAYAVRGPENRRRALIIGFERIDLGNRSFRPLRPCVLERRRVDVRIERPQEIAIGGNRFGDEVSRRGGEYRPAFQVVAVEQGLAPPPLQQRGQLPAEVARVLKTGIDP